MNRIKKINILFFSFLSFSYYAFGQNAPSSNPSNNTFLSDNKGVYTVFANTIYPISFGLPFFYLTKGLIKKDKELQLKGLKYTGGLIVNELITDFVKASIYKQNTINTGFFSNPQGQYIIPSIPSRHSTTAFNTAATFAIYNPKWYYVIPSYLWASGVVYSRFQIGENYSTNIAGAVIIGVGSAYLNYFLYKAIFEKKKKEKFLNNYLLLK
jgi:membrane-associated phospholipid phosphatase